MEKQKILSELQDIFHDVLGDESIVLMEETVANDVEGWDSLTHIQLMVTIEKHFKIKFTSKEILSWKNVGEIIRCISERT
jgi:acyl carrier protein